MSLVIYEELEQGETWRAIPGFEGYEVSDLGRVRSYRRLGGGRFCLIPTPRLKKTHVGSAGYLSVTLQKPDGDRCSKYRVHTLVASAFLGPRPDGMQVAHNGMHKLTNEDVRAIRRLRTQGALQRELSASFGVSISAIQFVLNGRNWSHVTEDVA